MNLDVYKRLLTIDGYTGRDRAISKIKRDICSLSVDNPAHHHVLINNKKRHVTIASTQDLNVKTIIALPGESLGVGDHVVFAKKDYWITNCSTDDGIYAYGKMQQCTDVVRFISKVDGSIQEYPTILTNTTKFNTGETSAGRLNLVSGQFSMLLPINEHTILIDNEDRFMLDKRKDYPSCYRVTYVDPSTYGYDTGLLNIILLQCDFNPDVDNVELMIADYYKRSKDSSSNSDISFADSQLYIKVGGSEKTFTPILSEDVVLPLCFTVSMPSEYSRYVSYFSTDTSITFKASNDLRLIGGYIQLSVCDSNGDYQSDVLIALKGLV